MVDWRYFFSSPVKRNSLANLARVILGIPLSFIFTFFVLKKLSITGYGTWALSLSFFSYFTFIDLGLTTAITRFVSFHDAKEQNRVVNQIINTGLFFYLISGAILTFILFFGRFIIIHLFFKNTNIDINILQQILTLVILTGYIDFFFSTFVSILNGFQRMDLTSLLDFLKSVAFISLGFILLSLKPTVLNLAFALFGGTILWGILSLAFCKLTFNKLSFSPNLISKKTLKQLFNFGLQIQFTSLAFFIHFNFDKLIIGFFLGVEKVGFLDIALKLINQSRMLASSFISPLLPAAVEKTVRFKDQLIVFYKNSLKYVVFSSGIIFTALLIFSPLVIRIWLGPGFQMAAQATQILCLGHFINLLTGPAASILLAQGNTKPVMFSSIFAGLANIILSLIGVYFFGFYGAVLGTTTALFLVDGLYLYLFPKYFHFPK